ncbi:hypothetical protein DXH84_00720 [Salmonella enterica]|nr:hypothetical protein [Salmonella enterica]HBC0267711.1 terminase family protein [Salmonella enterica subsp. enterica serovar Napoli]
MIQDAFVRLRAKQLYWQGYPPAEISRLMGISQNTIYSWKKRDEWDETPPVARVTQSIDARLVQLTGKPDKTGGDFKEIDLLTRQLKKLSDGQPTDANGTKKPRKRKLKNHFTEEQIIALREKIMGSLAWHQRGWYEQRHHRNRMILKSRQIGATWYFAREALLDALRDDVKYPYQRNQIFLSASRRQAFQFKTAIQEVALEVDVELKGGDKIILSNGAQLHFLGTSAATAQSYTGNLKFDEFFWVSNFINLRKVAGAMATLKELTRTYFSNGDSGALCVVAPPAVPGGRFRTIETRQVQGLEFEEQARVIEDITLKYNVQHIGIDVTGGNGDAVYQIVKKFFPAAVPYNFTLASKRALVMKMLQVIRAGRWEYDCGDKALVTAFNAVRRIKTQAGFITYDTDRSRGVSHGDLAWANMLAIINEPLGDEDGAVKSLVMEF